MLFPKMLTIKRWCTPHAKIFQSFFPIQPLIFAITLYVFSQLGEKYTIYIKFNNIYILYTSGIWCVQCSKELGRLSLPNLKSLGGGDTPLALSELFTFDILYLLNVFKEEEGDEKEVVTYSVSNSVHFTPGQTNIFLLLSGAGLGSCIKLFCCSGSCFCVPSGSGS